VANSYGLAYIPEGVNLPDHVTMATADETLPPRERAKWATYPILAIQGWAQAHDQKLRAVIATEEQFASFDPGTAKIVLRPDDIPESVPRPRRRRFRSRQIESAVRWRSSRPQARARSTRVDVSKGSSRMRIGVLPTSASDLLWRKSPSVNTIQYALDLAGVRK
jgi:hypothetical protein